MLREISVSSEMMAGIVGRNQSTRRLQSAKEVLLPVWILSRFLLQTWRNLKSKAENGNISEVKIIQGKNVKISQIYLVSLAGNFGKKNPRA